MTTTSTPYGLVYAGKLGASPAVSPARWYKMKQNDSGKIYNGDPVIIINTGTDRGLIQRCNTTLTATTTTTSGTFLGVFIGCRYTNPSTGQPTWQNWYPGSINAADLYAEVIDDPLALFKIQADGAVAQTRVGCNAALIQTAVGNDTTGISGLQLQASSLATTNTLPLRVVDFGQAPNNAVGDTYTEVIVRLNTHLHLTATGTAAS